MDEKPELTPEGCAVISVNLSGTPTPILEVINEYERSRFEMWQALAECILEMMVKYPELLERFRAKGFLTREIVPEILK